MPRTTRLPEEMVVELNNGHMLTGMAVVLFLRGINVRDTGRFAQASSQVLSDYDVLNVGAAGTFIARQADSQANLRSELQARLRRAWP